MFVYDKVRQMRKKVIKPVLLAAVFIAALILFSISTNQTNEDLTMAMEEASLPLVSFYCNGTQINELHGYTTEMDMVKMRDTITPLGANRMLSVGINTYGAAVDGIFYEIRGLDGNRLVADGDIEAYETVGNQLKADVQIQNLLDANEEYLFILTLQSGGENIYYYTRLMQTTEYYVDECLEFALQFHDYTFRDDAADFIPTYMDPATGDATTLNYVDLSCTLRQITWANFDPVILYTPTVSIKEINDSYNVITLDYVVTYTGDSGEVEYYNVEEYYRLRETSTRMYVLNFERRMNQIFSAENTFVTDSSNIQLGIRDSEIEYGTSEAGDVVAFVQEGDLWCYNYDSNELVQVFSFRGAEGVDARENWDQHDISIVRIDEAGSIDFIVYGYMNRGSHEGEVGIGVYHFDGLSHTVEEEVFLPVRQSYEILQAELGQLMYENDQGFLYLMMNEEVYRINLVTLEVENVLSELKDGSYYVSDSHRYLAWVESGSLYSSREINLMDLKDGSISTVTEASDQWIRPLGFIGEDFIYGIADEENVQMDAAGKTAFPMSAIKIMDMQEGHEILKTYYPQEGYVSDISISDYVITVELLRSQDGQYVKSGTDTIMNREADTVENAAVVTTVTDVKETQMQLSLKNAITEKKTRQITSKQVILEEERLVELEPDENEERFYVYVKGDVLLATDSISDAILLANDQMGVVINTTQQYVWMRARKTSQSAFSNLAPNDADTSASSVVQCISAMLMRKGEGISVSTLVENGQSIEEILENTLKDSMVLDLTGCSVEEILFYVSSGSPVFAMTDSDNAVLVVGYTSSTISYYDPQTQQISTKSWDSAVEWFESAGNIFFSYLDKN
jgi:virulence-associated protein VapD